MQKDSFISLLKRLFSFLKAEGKTDEVITETEPQFYGIVEDWLTTLEGLSKDLFSIAENSERDFLIIGGQLQDFSTVCIQKINGILSSIEEVEKKSRLNLSKLRTSFESTYDEAGACLRIIDLAANDIEGLRVSLEDLFKLKQILSDLSMEVISNGVCMKIEIAKSTGQDFKNIILATDELNQKISKGNKQLAQDTKKTFQAVTAVLLDLRNSLGKFDQQINVNKGRWAELLQSMEEITFQIEDNCHQMTKGGNLVRPEINEIVSAIQYHDICRQQMEHIAEALDTITEKIRLVLDTGETVDEKHKAIIIDSIRLQIAHVKNVMGLVTQSKETIAKNLSTIKNLSQEQGDRASGIKANIDSDVELIEKISKELKLLPLTLEATKNFAYETIDDIASVSRHAENMAENIGVIKIVRRDLNFLAVNATIKAAHEMDKGVVLGVISNKIEVLCRDVKKEIIEKEEASYSILETSNHLKMELSDKLMERITATESISQNTFEAITELGRGDQIIIQSMNDVGDAVKNIGKKISELESDIHFDYAINEKLEAINEKLEGMLIEIKSTLLETEEGASEKSLKELEELKRSYTMQSERDVHDSLFDQGLLEGQIDAEGTEIISESVKSNTHSGGNQAEIDNVDLFEEDSKSDDMDNVELFEDNSKSDETDSVSQMDNVDLFDDDSGKEEPEPDESEGKDSKEEDFGENVDLF